MGRHRATICLVLIVILLYQCMMRKQWTNHSNLWFGNVFVMTGLHYGFTAMKMQIIIWITLTPLMDQVRFTMKTEKENDLEFSNLTLKFTVDVYSKPTNSFTYVDPKTCYPSRNTKKILEGIALKLRRICDLDGKCEKRSNEYQNYLITRNYSPSLVAQ